MSINPGAARRHARPRPVRQHVLRVVRQPPLFRPETTRQRQRRIREQEALLMSCRATTHTTIYYLGNR